MTSALDHLNGSMVHRQGKDEWAERNVVKKAKILGCRRTQQSQRRKALRFCCKEIVTWLRSGLFQNSMKNCFNMEIWNGYSCGGKELRQPPKRESEILYCTSSESTTKADRAANLVAKGVENIELHDKMNKQIESDKVPVGQSDGRCGCGIGIQEDDTNRLVNISEIAVPLRKSAVLWRLKLLV